MKTALISFCVLVGMLTGCGGGGGETATTDPSSTQGPPGTSDTGTDPSTTASPTTSTSETTSPGETTSLTTTGETTSTTTSEPTTSSSSSTSEPGTGESTTTPDTTTGGLPGGLCETNKDCELLSDCCRCEAIAVGDPVPTCDAPECLIPQCDSLGIDEVFCRFGTCVTEKLGCDASAIACDQAPPDCAEGTLPGVVENGTCWTNGCVPVDLCDVVPSCDACPEDRMCVVDETLFGPKTRCEPIPAACAGQPSCACAEAACDQGFEACMDTPNGLYCFCPNC